MKLRISFLLFPLIALATQPARAGGPTDDEVKSAIERGISFLRDQQEPGGSWSYTFNHDHRLGITALAGLALLENGVERDDPAIHEAQAVVRELAPASNQTYDIALAILFLARIQPGSQGPNDDLIQRLGRRLAAGQCQPGMWAYLVPSMPAESGGGRSRTTRQRLVQALIGGGPGDNSNTQFALLGLWAASRHGADVNGALAAIDAHFRDSQADDGRWGYQLGGGGSQAMNCAGLIGLAIAASRPERAERETARARGAALAADDVFKKGLAVVAREARDIDPNSDIYYLWSLERVCVALGLRELDGLDWYARGASELLRRQSANGSWPAGRWGTMPSTCLALLFLRKANLAFEIDRVLKLPGTARDRVAKTVEKPEADPEPSGGPDVTVKVRQVEEKQFPEVTLDFEVKRGDGTPILDARQTDFRVTEFGRDVPTLRFRGPRSTEARPTTIVLVVDRSQSMEEEDRIGGLKKAVASFLESIPSGSEVAVIAFGSEVDLICDFTSDRGKILKAVHALTPGGATRYYDAVAEAIRRLSPKSGRRAVLALTDGEDTFSRSATLDSVILDARRAGLPVHTLGLGSDDEIESDALRKLAADTRGQYFSARQSDQLRAIYEELARDLGQSYSLSYRTDRPLPDGTLRPIRIYYRASQAAGEAEVFIRGMVVPQAGWERLFLGLVGLLLVLAILPGVLTRRAA